MKTSSKIELNLILFFYAVQSHVNERVRSFFIRNFNENGIAIKIKIVDKVYAMSVEAL